MKWIKANEKIKSIAKIKYLYYVYFFYIHQSIENLCCLDENVNNFDEIHCHRNICDFQSNL